MRPNALFAFLAATACLAALPVVAQDAEGERFPARLAGQVVLPAASTLPAPDDAPDFLQTAGKFTGEGRTEELGALPGMDGVRPTGLALPIKGQSLQGFSGIKAMEDGTFWTMSDNGFGSKANSADAMLMLHHVTFDWNAGTLERLETLFLADPDRVAPFPIVLKGTDTRYLTGADFDVESIQPVEDGFWVGEEFGPYLLKFDQEGRLQAVHETRAGETQVRSPDHPALRLPANPEEALPDFNLRRSGGMEGMALSPDGTRGYAMLEGPLYADGETETVKDGRTGLRVLEFDTGDGAWTGRSWLYPLAEGGIAIGDFNLIDETRALVIERDNGAGLEAQACEGEPAEDCFSDPARVKRVYLVSMTEENEGAAVEKLGFIDLLDIEDPDGVAAQGSEDGVYTMPFVTIENVDRVDETHIVVGNDNNYPFSAGRALDAADDNEFVLIEAGELLSAR